jgi:trichothecene 3-O-acetyltransferase
MPITTGSDRLDDYVDILGQQPRIQIYTQICLCYSLQDGGSSHRRIIDTLMNGLERLTTSFPWVAGQVVNEGTTESNTGVFKIKPLDRIPRLVLKDLTNDPSFPTMDVLRQTKFPFRMMDESIIAPRNTIPGTSGESPSGSFPIFLVQANFINGGLLLTFVGLHSVMDMTGQGQIIRLFSKACHNEPFTAEELSSGNLDRRNIIPLLDESYKPGPEIAHQISKHSLTDVVQQEAPGPIPKCTWTYFSFSSASLKALKWITKDNQPTSGFISTDDALTAFIWKSVARARLSRMDPTTESSLARAVDVRRYLDIPQGFTGLIQNMTYHKSTLQQLAEKPLGVVALPLRSAIDPKTSKLAYNTRALATFMDRSPDKSVITFTASIKVASDIMISSWAKVNCYEQDFNLGLGKPEAVRRPQFIPYEGLIYFMPKRPDGEIVVGMCLRDEDIAWLKADDDNFTGFVNFID